MADLVRFGQEIPTPGKFLAGLLPDPR